MQRGLPIYHLYILLLLLPRTTAKTMTSRPRMSSSGQRLAMDIHTLSSKRAMCLLETGAVTTLTVPPRPVPRLCCESLLLITQKKAGCGSKAETYLLKNCMRNVWLSDELSLSYPRSIWGLLMLTKHRAPATCSVWSTRLFAPRQAVPR